MNSRISGTVDSGKLDPESPPVYALPTEWQPADAVACTACGESHAFTEDYVPPVEPALVEALAGRSVSIVLHWEV